MNYLFAAPARGPKWGSRNELNSQIVRHCLQVWPDHLQGAHVIEQNMCHAPDTCCQARIHALVYSEQKDFAFPTSSPQVFSHACVHMSRVRAHAYQYSTVFTHLRKLSPEQEG